MQKGPSSLPGTADAHMRTPFFTKLERVITHRQMMGLRTGEPIFSTLSLYHAVLRWVCASNLGASES